MDLYDYQICDNGLIWHSICRSYERPCIAAACEIGLIDALEKNRLKTLGFD